MCCNPPPLSADSDESADFKEVLAAAVRRTSHCDIDVAVDIADFKNLPEKEDVAPFLIGSFDIECVPEGGRGFPDGGNFQKSQLAVKLALK